MIISPKPKDDPLRPKRQILSDLLNHHLGVEHYSADHHDLMGLREPALDDLIQTYEARSKGPFVSGF